MKKSLFTLAFSLIIMTMVYGQEIRLHGYAGYVFDDKFDTYYSSTEYIEGKIKGGLLWGTGIEYKMHEMMGVELMYFRQDTEAPVRYWDVFERDRTIDLGLNYIMLGGVRYLPTGGKLEPYAGLMLGMAIYSNKNPQNNEPTSATKFAWGARLGTNIWMSEKVGLKLQAQLLSSVQSMGGGFYVGTGGAGAGVSSYSTMYQFGLGGGLVIKVK